MQPSLKQCQISVVVHLLGAGVITTEPAQDIVNAGTEVTSIATPEIGFFFDYWWMNAQISEPITFVILNSDMIVEVYLN